MIGRKADADDEAQHVRGPDGHAGRPPLAGVAAATVGLLVGRLGLTDEEGWQLGGGSGRSELSRPDGRLADFVC